MPTTKLKPMDRLSLPRSPQDSQQPLAGHLATAAEGHLGCALMLFPLVMGIGGASGGGEDAGEWAVEVLLELLKVIFAIES